SASGSQRNEAAHGLLSLVPPLVAAATVRAARGQRPMPLQAGWIGFAYAAGAGMGAIRAFVQRSARESWAARTQEQVRVEARVAQVRAVLGENTGHHFKRALAAVGMKSAPARAAAAEQAARPASETSKEKGSTLFEVAGPVPIEPEAARSLWLTDHQARRLARFAAQMEEAPLDADDEVFTLIGGLDAFGLPATGQHFCSRYLGDNIEVTPDRPVVQWIIDGAPAGLAGAAVWKLLNWERLASGVLPARALLVPAAIDVGGIAVHLVVRRTQLRSRVVPAIATCNALLFAEMIRRTPHPPTMADGTPAFPATSGTLGPLIVLGNYWNQLGRERYAALTVLAGIVLFAPPPERRSIDTAIYELCFAAMAFFGAKGLQERTDSERDWVTRQFQQDYQRAVSDAHRAATADQLTYYRNQLRLVRYELRRRDLQFDEDTTAWVDEACNELDAWINEAQVAMDSGQREPA
ncbi:MAG TPA: hypothetical protein VNB06_06060, partial [Thermoanaerobaculia bacterium]|nr:hypothetical protein [Thermoanaerobaculia bacterium]